MIPIDDPAVRILLASQLALSLWAMWTWATVLREAPPSRLKWAAAATACWFAGSAVIIAYLFDVGP